MCLGCSQVRPNIKIQKLCEDTGENSCTSCYCRPMWCSECMAKWFASRQDTEQQNRWLSSKCTCPMCRATFCMLDVCRLHNTEDDWPELIVNKKNVHVIKKNCNIYFLKLYVLLLNDYVKMADNWTCVKLGSSYFMMSTVG